MCPYRSRTTASCLLMTPPPLRHVVAWWPRLSKRVPHMAVVRIGLWAQVCRTGRPQGLLAQGTPSRRRRQRAKSSDVILCLACVGGRSQAPAPGPPHARTLAACLGSVSVAFCRKLARSESCIARVSLRCSPVCGGRMGPSQFWCGSLGASRLTCADAVWSGVLTSWCAVRYSCVVT